MKKVGFALVATAILAGASGEALDPANVCQLGRSLLRFSNRQRVFITTHSIVTRI